MGLASFSFFADLPSSPSSSGALSAAMIGPVITGATAWLSVTMTNMPTASPAHLAIPPLDEAACASLPCLSCASAIGTSEFDAGLQSKLRATLVTAID